MSRLDTFVEDSLEIIRMRQAVLEPQEARDPLSGTLWLSRSTGRRGRVLWASRGIVCLSYDETDLTAQKCHPLEDFLRLYTEIQ